MDAALAIEPSGDAPQGVSARMKRLLLGRVYSIGIYTGASPLALAPGVGQDPVLTRECIRDLHATFVADPFMIRVDGAWYMFFEIMTWRAGSKKGEIGLATSRDGLRWTYERVVLAEPCHLSYPHVFEWGSEHWLIPESSGAGGVRLYRADPFPTRWVFVAELLRGPVFLDNSVFRHDGRWWMLSETDPRRGTLRLFHAPDLEGPWTEHPGSPVVQADRRIARPAGRIVATGDRLVRFAQDCRGAYGTGVHALEITRLTRREYQERELGDERVLGGSGQGWNRSGMHHVDAHQQEDGSWIACVDGWSNRVRRPRDVLRWATDRWVGSA
jgi:hypothetical protein